eukprot:SAG22_NODE_133_length_18379_cov_34.571937_4_plen_185_part_00
MGAARLIAGPLALHLPAAAAWRAQRARPEQGGARRRCTRSAARKFSRRPARAAPALVAASDLHECAPASHASRAPTRSTGVRACTAGMSSAETHQSSASRTVRESKRRSILVHQAGVEVRLPLAIEVGSNAVPLFLLSPSPLVGSRGRAVWSWRAGSLVAAVSPVVFASALDSQLDQWRGIQGQ